MKKFAVLITWMLVMGMLLTGCGGNPAADAGTVATDTNHPTGTSSANPSASHDAGATPVAGGNGEADAAAAMEASKDIDLQRAVAAGWLDATLLDHGTRQIGYPEFLTLLDGMIRHVDASRLPDWEAVSSDARASKRNMRREDGMLAIHYAADVLGVADTSNYNWDPINTAIGEPWGDLSNDYPEFPDWETQQSPFEGQGWNYMASAYFYGMGRASRYSYRTLFDYDADNATMHPSAPFTVLDAAKAAARLSGSIIVQQPLSEAATENHIPADLLAQAKQMPSWRNAIATYPPAC